MITVSTYYPDHYECEKPKPPIVPAKSWTHREGDSEAKREHDFSNWLQELVYAVEKGDLGLVAFCADELRKAYKLANRNV